MSGKLLRKLIGVNNYMNTVGYAVRLYKSVFTKIGEPGADLLKYYVKPGDTFFDFGANIGRFSTFAISLVGKTGSVYSFEPLIYPRRIIRHMKKLRRLKQLHVCPMAVSDYEGSATIVIPKKDGKPQTATAYITDRTDIDPEKNVLTTVDIVTLDGFCAQNNIQKVDAIKCDVEGLEFKVFQGGIETIKKHKPVIYCEIEPAFYKTREEDISAVFRLLGDIGYKSYLPNEDCTKLVPRNYEGLTQKEDFFFIPDSKLVKESVEGG